MDMGDLTSRQIGEIMAGGLLRAEEQLMEEQAAGRRLSQHELAEQGKKIAEGQLAGQGGFIPSALVNQNLGHNAKQEAMGPNINQKK